MKIDWPELLRQHHVDFAEGGANVSKGHIAVKCPYCGVADESHHMSISLTRGSWRCWRNPEHRGGDPVKLLSALLRCSSEHARTLLGPEYRPMPDDLLTSVRTKLFPDKAASAPPLTMPKEFWKLRDEPQARRFILYLRGRGFASIERLQPYGLHYCTHGYWRDRLIFLVERDRKLAAWTGRSVQSNPVLRYMAEGPIADHLLWFDQLQNCRDDVILLCEGPFDALKVCYLGQGLGITATCWFTATPNRRQIGLLHELLPRFRSRILLLDRDAGAKALAVAKSLNSLNVRRVTLPARYKDPGELDEAGLLALV